MRSLFQLAMKSFPHQIFVLLFFTLAGVWTLVEASPPKYATALEALRTYERSGSKVNTDVVVGLIGFYGQDQPRQWLVLAKDTRLEGMMHEFVVSNDEVRAQRHFKRLANQDLPDVPINRADVKIDSSKAFRLVESLAAKAGIGFDTIHYQLRCRDLRNEPIWVLNLIDSRQVSIGVHYYSAITGELLRSNWHPDGVEEEKGPIPKVGEAIKNAAGKIKGARQAQRTP